MPLPSTGAVNFGEWLESGAAALMDIAVEFDTFITKVHTTEQREISARVVCHIASCYFRMKDLGLRYTNFKHHFIMALRLENALDEACQFLKGRCRSLTGLLKSQKRADALEDAYYAGDLDRFRDMEREDRELFRETILLNRAVSVYQRCLIGMVGRSSSYYACQLLCLANGFEDLRAKADELFQLIDDLGNSEQEGTCPNKPKKTCKG
ncbi:hypothetical protein VP1G_03360 [Cytospora mali]|uniref:Uncharacterized protein n=1 Tax=Cytospora mali TaxID=578113 RepID=A0A194UWN0_CYTMA|nr:hypothetical protein VP1G_03360 [Valsa mali var. pyri (nom. inval.)]